MSSCCFFFPFYFICVSLFVVGFIQLFWTRNSFYSLLFAFVFLFTTCVPFCRGIYCHLTAYYTTAIVKQINSCKCCSLPANNKGNCISIQRSVSDDCRLLAFRIIMPQLFHFRHLSAQLLASFFIRIIVSLTQTLVSLTN